jgi:hypothetical protein
MTWATGEFERMQLFLAERAARARYRVYLERSLVAPSDGPFLASQADYAALVRDALQGQQPPEDDAVLFPDSPVVVNHNLW